MIDSSDALLLAELIVLLVAVAFAVDLLQRRLGAERLRTWMGGPPVLAALKGIAIGFITPFCTYSAIPMLVGLRQAGVRPAGYTAFIVAAPVLDPILFGALVLIVGWQAAVVYLVVAFTAAMALAFTAERVGLDRHLKPIPATVGGPAIGDDECGSGSCDGPEIPWQGLRNEARDAGQASLRLLRSMAPLLGIGIAIGIAITVLVPADAASSVMEGRGALAVPIAAALGTPLYFSTELFVPIADSLTIAGVSTGAVVALTIAGAGANIPEFVILGKLFRRGVLTVFVGYVFVVAMLGGALASVLAV